MTEAKRPADVVQAAMSESAAIRRLNDAREKIRLSRLDEAVEQLLGLLADDVLCPTNHKILHLRLS